MERLTWKHGLDGYTDVGLRDGVSVGDAICHLADYEDAMPIERAQELSQAEKDGRLVVLPCKVGDTLYYTTEFGIVETTKVRTFCIGHPSRHVEDCRLKMIRTEKWDISIDKFGKTVFLTREESEAALKKREEVDDETD